MTYVWGYLLLFHLEIFKLIFLELEQQGYVLTIPAKGTFVSYGYRDRLKELGMLKLDEMLSKDRKSVV